MIFGFMYLSTFGLARAAKSFPGIYRNTTKLQKVRIWRPRTSATSDLRPKNVKKFFFAFLEELGNSKHFEPYIIFSPNWRSGARQWRHVAKLAKLAKRRPYEMQRGRQKLLCPKIPKMAFSKSENFPL